MKMWICKLAWKVLWLWWPDRFYVISSKTYRYKAQGMANLGFNITEYIDGAGRKVKPKESQ